jgi:enediyne biosynthesis protein E4
MKKIGSWIGLLSLATLLACGKKEKPLFKQLSPEKTGVTFNNQIKFDDQFNILTYEYIYNGGGVGIADFNKDGQQDLFFSGNQVDNKLYLNRGDWKFDDVTEPAGVSGKGRWKSGVGVVDINADGLQDVYVTCMTYKPGPQRANLLYVNQGVKNGTPIFREMAAEYGIADTNYSTNCAFFDYDRDGDLDLFLSVNHQEQEELPNAYKTRLLDSVNYNRDRLYRNDFDAKLGHAHFTDVSVQAGISGEGYGLAINICDLNQDGWKDIYVSNDYLSTDHLYINNQNGTFSDRAGAYFKHTSYSAMGNEVSDLNNDGLMEVIALDMLPEDNLRRKTMLTPNNYNSYQNNAQFGYQFQHVRNTLQWNQGMIPGKNQPAFAEIAMLAGVSSTDWSWTPMVADFDHDGLRDLVVTNGFPRDITDRDFMDYHSDVSSLASIGMLMDRIPSIKLKNYAFRNLGGLKFENASAKWGFDTPSFSNGAAYGDLDNDGDLDLVINNIDDPAMLYQNQQNEQQKKAEKKQHWLNIRLVGEGQNPAALGATIHITYGKNDQQVWEYSPYRGYLSSIQPLAHFGLGENEWVKSITVTWPDGAVQTQYKVKADQVLEIKKTKTGLKATNEYLANAETWFKNITTDLGIDYVQKESDFIDFNLQPLLPHKLSQFGPGMSVADVNGDGLDDVFIGAGHLYKGKFLLQKSDGRFELKDLLPGKEGPEKLGEELGTLFFDADGDGDQDLYCVRGGNEFPADNAVYQDIFYENQNGQFQHNAQALPAFLKSGSCVRAADYDQDGDLDLLVAGRHVPHQFPLPASSFLLKNESKKGQIKFQLDAANNKSLDKIGLVCDALWTDYDHDGWQDLLLAGEFMPLTFLKNEKGKFKPAQTQGLNEAKGCWTSLAGADFDGDGDTDYIAGNLGQNHLFKATEKQPLRIYAADFDSNGGLDAVPAVYFSNEKGQAQEFPYHMRLDLDRQIITTKRFYLYHHEYAKTGMQDYLANFKNVKPLVLSATYLSSAYLENQGDGKFALHELPLQAQFAPLNGMAVADWNADGHLDVLAVGNDFGTEVTTGRLDACNGLLLLGNGKGGFKAASYQQSGFYVPGDAKSLVLLVGAKQDVIVLAGQNQGPVEAFRWQKPARIIRLNAEDVRLEWTANGRKQSQEVPIGQSFLSQSGRFAVLPNSVQNIQITTLKGQKRTI